MNKSDSIKEITAALVKAQANFLPILKTAEATIKGEKGSYSFKYAPLETILSAITPALLTEGIKLMQGIDGHNLETTLLHISGEWLSHSMEMPSNYASSRAYGSELSYRRRYSITSVLGITAEEDDDGQHAEREAESRARRSAARATATGVNQEAFESLPLKHQDHMRELEANVTAMLEEERDTDAYLYIEEQKLDDTEKCALWYLLGSRQRSRIKAASDIYRGRKPAGPRNKAVQ